jgi:hypothetical protein
MYQCTKFDIFEAKSFEKENWADIIFLRPIWSQHVSFWPQDQ